MGIVIVQPFSYTTNTCMSVFFILSYKECFELGSLLKKPPQVLVLVLRLILAF